MLRAHPRPHHLRDGFTRLTEHSSHIIALSPQVTTTGHGRERNRRKLSIVRLHRRIGICNLYWKMRFSGVKRL